MSFNSRGSWFAFNLLNDINSTFSLLRLPKVSIRTKSSVESDIPDTQGIDCCH